MKIFIVLLSILALNLANPLGQQRPLNDRLSVARKPAISEPTMSDSAPRSPMSAFDLLDVQSFNEQFEQAFNHNFRQFGLMQSPTFWFNGENVCKSEIVSNATAASRSPHHSLSSIMSTCVDYVDQHRCTTQSMHNGETKTITTIYECCSGWTRSETGACDQVENVESIVDTLHTHNLTHYLSIVDKAGRTSDWSADERNDVDNGVTIFAPTDDAFEKVDGAQVEIVTLDASTDEKQLAIKAIDSATVDGLKMTYDFVDDMKIDAVDGSVLRMSSYNYPMHFATINCAPIIEQNIKAIGGIIHVTSQVVVGAKQTLWELIGQNTQLTKFTGLINNDLQNQLLDIDSHLTVLAFTNQAFDSLPNEIKERVTKGQNCMSNLISSHILPNTICSAGVQGQMAFVRNMNDKLINASRITADNGVESIKFNGHSTVRKDIVATNGVLHIIDGVIINDEMLDALGWLQRHRVDIYDLIVDDDKFVNALRDDNKVTVFLPPPRALAKLVNSTTIDNVKEILANHIIIDNVEDNAVDATNKISDMFIDLPSSITTINGNVIDVRRIKNNPGDFGLLSTIFSRPPQFTIGGCTSTLGMKMKVCAADLIGVDSMITSSSESVYDILKNTPELSSIATIVDNNNIADRLRAPDFMSTLIAPTNEAIDQLSDEERANISSQIDNFILSGMICTDSMGSQIGPLSRTIHKTVNNKILISSGNNQLSIGGTPITKTDLSARNGIVQVVNNLPQLAELRRQPSIQQLFSHWINH